MRITVKAARKKVKTRTAPAPKEARKNRKPVCSKCGFPRELHVVGFCMPGARDS